MGRKLSLGPLVALLCAAAMYAQTTRAVEWWTFGADAQRDGWAQGEAKTLREDIRNYHLLWSRALGAGKPRAGSVLAPIVSSEAVIAASVSGNLWALSQDQSLWTKNFEVTGKKHKNNSCSGRLTAMPVLSEPAKPESGSVAPFASSRSLYVVSGDGMLRQLNPADGSDQDDPTPFVPRGVPVLPLNVGRNGILTATRSGCGEEGAVWSIDPGGQRAETFKLHADVAGLGGVALGKNGTVFVQTRDGAFDPPAGKWGGALLALTKDLELNDYFILPGTESKNTNSDMNSTSPTVITLHGQEMVVSMNRDGRIYVLPSTALGGADHHRYFVRSPVLALLDNDKAHGVWGGLASWQDRDGARYILAPVWGPPNPALSAMLPKANAPHGSVMALKFSEYRGVTSLNPVWISDDMDRPGIPVIAGGVVLVVSNGRQGQKHAHAILRALDAMTGEQLYSSKNQVTKEGSLTGLSVAGGKIYLTTVNRVIYAFGK